MGERIEEYKGYILAPGVTMPSYDIHNWDIYESKADFDAEKPVTIADSLDMAKKWVDDHLVQDEAKGAGETYQRRANLIELRGLVNAIDATHIKERIAKNLKDIESLARRWRKELEEL